MGNQQHIQESFGQFSRLVNNVAEVLYSASLTDPIRMEFINSRIESITGFDAEQICTGRIDWMELVHTDDRSGLLGAYEDCKRSGKGFELEYRIVKKDGNICDVLDRAVPVFDDNGHICGIDGMITEITCRKRAQRELDRTQMLQNLGRLTAGIAHEINTPIQFVGDNLHFLSNSFQHINELLKIYGDFNEIVISRPDGDESIPAAIEKIAAFKEQTDIDFIVSEIPHAIAQTVDGINRVSTMIKAMRDFSHIDERRMAPADLNKALNTAIVILRNEIKYTADVKMELDGDLPQVLCCIDEINQVFLILLINAAQSISEFAAGQSSKRGVITITTKFVDGNVVISISDTGGGIAPEIRDRIFEAFFTTKPAGMGTGQGLSIARSIIVDRHAGSLEFETEDGTGTTFTVSLPVERKKI
jgi:two-component system NtrC family sensor kinase